MGISTGDVQDVAGAAPGVDGRWLARLREYVAWTRAHGGAEPANHVADPEERTLAQWVSKQRKAHKRAHLSTTRVAYLDEHAPGWRIGRAEYWYACADAYIAWRNSHDGADPPATAADPEEKRLGIWVVRQRHALREGRLRLERAAYLDEHALGWHRSRRGDDKHWYHRADEYIAWRSHHGSPPSSTAADLEEKRLGRWAGKQRQARKQSRLSADKVAYLDDHVPGWRGQA